MPAGTACTERVAATRATLHTATTGASRLCQANHRRYSGKPAILNRRYWQLLLLYTGMYEKCFESAAILAACSKNRSTDLLLLLHLLVGPNSKYQTNDFRQRYLSTILCSRDLGTYDSPIAPKHIYDGIPRACPAAAEATPSKHGCHDGSLAALSPAAVRDNRSNKSDTDHVRCPSQRKRND